MLQIPDSKIFEQVCNMLGPVVTHLRLHVPSSRFRDSGIQSFEYLSSFGPYAGFW